MVPFFRDCLEVKQATTKKHGSWQLLTAESTFRSQELYDSGTIDEATYKKLKQRILDSI